MLLERDTELGLVDEFLDGVCRGKGGIAVLEGPPGIGKTALLRELGERSRQRDVEVTHAHASQLDHGFSFGVARQLLERRVREAGPAERSVLLGGAAEDALPALGIAGGDGEGDAGLRSLHGLYWLAANLAGRGPLVLCVDDAHWADRSSLSWLSYTAPRLADLPLGIVLATRPREPQAEQDLLDRLALDDSARTVSIQPLSPRAVGLLVDTSLEGDAAPEFEAACHHSTGGNPLLVRELLRELAAEAATPSAERAQQLEGFGVEAVSRNVRRRLHDLGPRATAIAQVVAVVGNGATAVEVAALCEYDEATVRAAAADLVATDLLLPETTTLAFVHPLVRAAVYEDMAAVQRAQLHRQVATMRDATGDPEQVAVHLLQVEPRADPGTVAVLRAAAAEAAGRGAPDAAATFLRRALTEPPVAGPSRAAVLVELGHAEALARMDGFEEHLAAAIVELDDPDQAAEVALSLGRALSSLGDGAGAFGVVETASATVDPDGSMAPLLEAELLTIAHAFAELRPLAADRAAGHLRRFELGEPVDAVVLGALAPRLLEEHPPAARAIRAAEAAIADARLDAGAGTVGNGVLLLAGYTLLGAGQPRRASEVFGATIAAARRRGELLTMGVASALRSETLYRLGEIVEAEGEARVAWGQAVGEGMAKAAEPIGLMVSTAMLVNALVARSELDEAERHIELVPLPLPPRTELFLPARAELRLAQGRTEEAIADLRAVGSLLGEEFFKPIQNWRARLAVALASVGEHEEAQELARAELDQARRWEVPLALGVALTAAGVVAGGDGGPVLLEEAVATLERTDGRLDHAAAMIELGALQRRSGSPGAARGPLRAGMDLAARCGATALADRAHAELVAAGARPRRDRRFLTGPESLTAGELRVATLAAEGLTDRAIAQRLYVTQAAVQFHLRNTFRKLDIRARGELSAALDPAMDGAKT